jgi:hypothetical protein
VLHEAFADHDVADLQSGPQTARKAADCQAVDGELVDEALHAGGRGDLAHAAARDHAVAARQATEPVVEAGVASVILDVHRADQPADFRLHSPKYADVPVYRHFVASVSARLSHTGCALRL